MKAGLLREWFQAEWGRGVAFAKVQGASTGAIRALVAYAEQDVQETLDTLHETGLADPRRGARVLQAWRQWYPAYVMAETTRLLPELAIRWPGDRAKRTAERSRKAMDRQASDGEDVLTAIELKKGAAPVWFVRASLGMSIERFDRTVDGLRAVGAVELRENRLIATANSALVRRALRVRWLGE